MYQGIRFLLHRCVSLKLKLKPLPILFRWYGIPETDRISCHVARRLRVPPVQHATLRHGVPRPDSRQPATSAARHGITAGGQLDRVRGRRRAQREQQRAVECGRCRPAVCSAPMTRRKDMML